MERDGAGGWLMADKVTFGKRVIEAIEVAAKRTYYSDTKVQGLILVVHPTGTKSFQVYRRPKNGAPTWHTLGRFPDMSVERTRQMALESLSEMTEGKKSQHTGACQENLWGNTKRGSGGILGTRKELKPRTVFDYYRHLNKNFRLLVISSGQPDIQLTSSKKAP